MAAIPGAEEPELWTASYAYIFLINARTLIARVLEGSSGLRDHDCPLSILGGRGGDGSNALNCLGPRGSAECLHSERRMRKRC